MQRREGYWQHELMTFSPWGINIRDELTDVEAKLNKLISATSITNDTSSTNVITATTDSYHYNTQEQQGGDGKDIGVV